MIRLWIKIINCLIALIFVVVVAILLFATDNETSDIQGIYLAMAVTLLCIMAILLKAANRRR